MELNTPKPGIARTTEPTTTQRIIEGKTNLQSCDVYMSYSNYNCQIQTVLLTIVVSNLALGCELMGTKLCNEGGATCDEGTDLRLAFSTSSVAHAKCQLGEYTNNHLL